MARLIALSRTALFLLAAVYLLLPVAAIVLYSIATSWTARALPDGYTIAHWLAAFGDARLLAALGRAFLLAAGVVLLDLALVIPVIYWQRVRNPRIRVAVELAAAVAFPFIYWAIDGAMATIGVVELDEAARMCGASAWQTLWLVIVPDIGPGIASGSMLVFALSFGEFALP